MGQSRYYGIGSAREGELGGIEKDREVLGILWQKRPGGGGGIPDNLRRSPGMNKSKLGS